MRRRTRRMIVGIEAAIVLIAFVIVAAALAFVALNMGLFTTQKSKEVIQRGLGEASSSLEVDGSVTGYTPDGSGITAMFIPIKLAPGRETVDLASTKTTIGLIIGSDGYANIHGGVYILQKVDHDSDPTTPEVYALVDASDTTTYYLIDGDLSTDDTQTTTTFPDASILAANLVALAEGSTSATVTNGLVASNTYLSSAPPKAYIVFLRVSNSDTVLEFGEKALTVVLTTQDGAATPYEKVSVEIRPPEGAPLTVERTIPATLPSSGGAVDLG